MPITLADVRTDSGRQQDGNAGQLTPTGRCDLLGRIDTLAALVDLANRTLEDHIMMVEDPIEFLHGRASHRPRPMVRSRVLQTPADRRRSIIGRFASGGSGGRDLGRWAGRAPGWPTGRVAIVVVGQ